MSKKLTPYEKEKKEIKNLYIEFAELFNDYRSTHKHIKELLKNSKQELLETLKLLETLNHISINRKLTKTEQEALAYAITLIGRLLK